MRLTYWSQLGDPAKGRTFMLGSLAIVGAGFVFTRPLPSIQGTVGMTLFGGGFLIVFAMLREGLGGLDPRRLTPTQRKGMLRHSVTSSLMKIGGPLAFAAIGAGTYSSITTLGSLLAGAALTSIMGRWLRVIVILGVLQATNVLAEPGNVNLLGLVAAFAAATHPFDLPNQAKLMGEKRDQCVAQANVICLIVVLPVCIPLSGYLGAPIGDWKWGYTEIVAMAMAGLLATALAAVMQTRASKYISRSDMGAWAATAPAVQPIVAMLVAPLVSLFIHVPTLIPDASQWTAFAIVAIASTYAVKVDSAAAQAADPTEKALGKVLSRE